MELQGFDSAALEGQEWVHGAELRLTAILEEENAEVLSR